MAERKPDPPVLRASIVDSGWEPEQPKERELPRYDEPTRELLVTRVDDQIQARAAAMNEEARASTDFTVPDAVAPPHLLVPGDERTVVDPSVPFTSSAPPSLFADDVDLSTPSLGEALRRRVRVAGGDVPLFAVVVPLLGVTALCAALVGGVLGRSGASAPAASTPAAVDAAASSAPVAPPGDATASGPAAPRAEPAPPPSSPGDTALAALEHKKPAELGTDDALALATGKADKALSNARALADRLAADPGLAKDPAVLTELQTFAAAPDTGRVALAAMARLPGPLSADLLYEVWTGTAEKSESTELARALLLGKDVRPKASPALAVALELREAETCEENLKLLSKATELGDKRALAPIARLGRRTGCGPTRRDDCFACLREGDALKNALVAVKRRREPELGKR
jgi:hypothetical protein